MTIIDIKRTMEVQQSLEEINRKIYRLYEESGQTSRQLKNLSGMQNVRRTLEYIMDDMMQEHKVLKMMERCLEDSCRNFVRYEDRIADYAEEVKETSSTESIFEAVKIPENLLRLLR